MSPILRSKRLLGLAALGAIVLLLAACTPSHPQSTFESVGPVARSQVNLFYIILWAGTFVFVVLMAVLLYVVVRYRRRPGQGDPEQIHGHTRLEIAWTIAPTIVLAIVGVPSLIAIFDTANSPDPPDKGGLVVEVIGHQWWFEFRYPDHDVITANVMHIPVDEVVNIRLDSVDVLHSFWVPKLAGKVDMVPNNDNTLWLMAEEAGIFFGQCAEFCGVSHANMHFRVIAQPRAEFDAWLKQQAADSMEPIDPLARRGQEVFLSREAGCFACHTIQPLRTARGTKGPNLTHFASRGCFAGCVLENTQEDLRAWLEDPEAIKPGNIMTREAIVYTNPDNELTEPEISALVAYLRSLK